MAGSEEHLTATPSETDESGNALTREEIAAPLFRKRDDPAVVEELVVLFFPLAESLARRFAGRGEALDDLTQVASIGLLKAIERFDPDRGLRFDTYAVPTIIGELKRHFRDSGWAIRVPRRLQERSLQIRQVMAELSQQLGRSPRVPEIAERAGLSDDDVLEALDAVHAHSLGSLDAPAGDGEQNLSDALGFEDHQLELAEDWVNLAPLLRKLGRRERALLYYRFIADMSQSQIAETLGISQMHVSRLLARTLATLRAMAGEGEETTDYRA